MRASGYTTSSSRAEHGAGRAPVRAAEIYMTGEYSGDLYELLNLFQPWRYSAMPRIDNAALDGFLKWFYDDPNHCSGECQKCRHCERFARASVGEEQSREVRAKSIAEGQWKEPFAAYWQKPWIVRHALRLARKARVLARGVRRRIRSSCTGGR